jgi:hypothetical protein
VSCVAGELEKGGQLTIPAHTDSTGPRVTDGKSRDMRTQPTYREIHLPRSAIRVWKEPLGFASYPLNIWGRSLPLIKAMNEKKLRMKKSYE